MAPEPPTKDMREFAFEEHSFLLGSAARDFIESEFALQAGFLNEHGFAGLLGDERVPEEIVVLPPGMIGGEVDVRREESGIEAIEIAAFVLADGDGRVGAGGTNGFAHAADPACETFLCEQERSHSRAAN